MGATLPIEQQSADPILSSNKGCPGCNFTGMKGRVALYEMMPTTQPMRDLIAKNSPTDEIRRLAREEGMLTLREAGLRRRGCR